MSEEGKPSEYPLPQATPAAPQAPLISIEEFRRMILRVGVITTAQEHPNADRLLVLTVDAGEGAPRQVVAGIKGSYEPSALVGKQVVIVTNLKPAVLRGVESQGMVLAASDGSSVILITPERSLPPGSTVK